MTNELTMDSEIIQSSARAVMEYGVLACFFVVVMLLIVWVVRKVVTVLLPAVVNWINKQVELMDTIQATVTGIDSSVKSSEGVAKNISTTLQEHTNILKKDGAVLVDVKQATDRIERKVETLA